MLYVEEFQSGETHPRTPSPLVWNNNHRPLSQCRQFASGDLHSQNVAGSDTQYFRSAFDSGNVGAQSGGADDTYVTMSNLQQPTFGGHRFPALLDSLDSQQIANFSSSSSSSSSSLENPCDTEKTLSRKRKRPYVPHVQRKAETVVKRNSRERRRMGTLQGAFRTLQKHLPIVKHSCKRIPKEKLLRVATDYIRHLQLALVQPEISTDELGLFPGLSFLPKATSSTTSVTSPCITSPDVMPCSSSPFQTSSATSMTSPAPSSPASTSSLPPTSPTSPMQAMSPTTPTSLTSHLASTSSASLNILNISQICQHDISEDRVEFLDNSKLNEKLSLNVGMKIGEPFVMTPDISNSTSPFALTPGALEMEGFDFINKSELMSLFDL